MAEIAPRPTHINTLWGRIVIDELLRCGLRTICVSPGSRSTPLVAAAAQNPGIEAIPIVDERSAAFFASGIARRRDEPVALLCTSGTAGAHYFPALCEARASRLPLLVLTADRPPRLQECGASQAMDQRDLFAPHRVWFQQVAEPEARADKLRALRSLIDRAVARSRGTLGATSGPVHLNFPFRKPLEPGAPPSHPTDAITDAFWDEARAVIDGRGDAQPQVSFAAGSTPPPSGAMDGLTRTLHKARRPLIIAGADRTSNAYATDLIAAAAAWQIPVLAESTSSLRHDSRLDDPKIHSVDYLLESDAYSVAPPDLIIRCARPSVQWSGRKALANWAHTDHLLVTRYDTYEDPNHHTAHQLIADEARFFQALEKRAPETPLSAHRGWLDAHRRFDDAGRRRLHHELDNVATDAPALSSAAEIWHHLTQHLHTKAALFVASSMPIRDVDTFSAHRDLDIDLYFQRGLNGIDGTLSTGLGIAHDRRHHNAATVLAIGDVAYRHDQGALALVEELDINATVVVFDNGGGGIFDYLPIAELEGIHDQFFATTGHRPLDLADSPRLNTMRAETANELNAALEQSIESSGTTVIRAITQRDGDKHWRQSIRDTVANHAFGQTSELWESLS